MPWKIVVALSMLAQAAQAATAAATPSRTWMGKKHHEAGPAQSSANALTDSGDFCQVDLDVSCKIDGFCQPWRGEVYCGKDEMCHCKKGSCASLGACYSQTKCEEDTGGTCKIFGCKSWRGATSCVHGKCICKPGGCVMGNSGVCSHKCDKYTGGTSFDTGTCKGNVLTGPGTCKLDRGPVNCVDGYCVCKQGYCASRGTCYPYTGKFQETSTNITDLSASWQAEATDDMTQLVPACAMFCAAFAVISVAFGIVAWHRRNPSNNLAEVLLPEEQES